MPSPTLKVLKCAHVNNTEIDKNVIEETIDDLKLVELND
jgi:hypothetical protein